MVYILGGGRYRVYTFQFTLTKYQGYKGIRHDNFMYNNSNDDKQN